MVLIGVVAIVGATWASTAWLLAEADQTTIDKRAGLRIDAIRTGLTVAAGTGGAFALLLAVRRQWLNERAQAHREEVDHQSQIHDDRVATATEHDAAERRITDLYVKAVDQLGNDKAAVRLGGLYALERLGQNSPGHRQTVVDVICAYLRMPFTPPAESPEHDDLEHSRSEELQVRLTAQRVLAAHLRDEIYKGQRDEGAVPETFWPGIDIDLTGACLVDFFLGDCRVGVVTCHDARFVGETICRGLICDLAFFQGATFGGHTDFRGASFTYNARFSYARFATDVRFNADEFFPGAHFRRHVSFQNVAFAKGARFDGATFSGSADFDEATYEGGAKAIHLEGAHIQDLNAVSPEVTKKPSTWPPGWIVKQEPDGTGTLTWKQSTTKQATRRKPT
ncbi:pentapeptide repeat-containing protein [Acrocarpospora sp. B8E8]|uniref:pentapeptide repeat-containing protein n=1 Tax=Acrocarpospora sp. B8E8 TaxID=3153572 RepID=UPI00325CD9AA